MRKEKRDAGSDDGRDKRKKAGERGTEVMQTRIRGTIGNDRGMMEDVRILERKVRERLR
jgi:hypothetical protein